MYCRWIKLSSYCSAVCSVQSAVCNLVKIKCERLHWLSQNPYSIHNGKKSTAASCSYSARRRRRRSRSRSSGSGTEVGASRIWIPLTKLHGWWKRAANGSFSPSDSFLPLAKSSASGSFRIECNLNEHCFGLYIIFLYGIFVVGFLLRVMCALASAGWIDRVACVRLFYLLARLSVSVCLRREFCNRQHCIANDLLLDRSFRYHLPATDKCI